MPAVRRPAPDRRITFERQRRRLTQRRVGTLVPEFGGQRRLFQTEISLIEMGRLIPRQQDLLALGRLFNVFPPEKLLEIVSEPELMTA